ncbi:hypothetical protein [Streptomyces sp. NPDC001594]|uniref:hypothetical protein n=1 Tax=Streptomyces sp. NPDC001594 TaxID=3364590 RepID=UPI0036BDE274
MASFGSRAHIGRPGWTAAVVATVAEGVGTAVAPLLAGEPAERDVAADQVKALAAALAELPSDEAFG